MALNHSNFLMREFREMSELLCKKALRIDPGGGVVSKFKDLFFLAVCVSSQLIAPNTNGHFLSIFKVPFCEQY